ncbi:hypothetical protein B0H19DRAFT_1064822 [Mycena capillaripes]|nr:hypothetical protein B0H19DRAFT_1064822 [Mycena capillaripes]
MASSFRLSSLPTMPLAILSRRRRSPSLLAVVVHHLRSPSSFIMLSRHCPSVSSSSASRSSSSSSSPVPSVSGPSGMLSRLQDSRPKTPQDFKIRKASSPRPQWDTAQASVQDCRLSRRINIKTRPLN